MPCAARRQLERVEEAYELEAWKEGGGSHFSLRAMDTGSELMGLPKVGDSGPADYIAALEKFRSEAP